jgi:hypothetical protein
MITIFSVLLAVTTALPKPTCLPPFWGGILAGGTSRPEVTRLYGEGVYLPDEKGFPASYYVDTKGAVTLHVIYGTDDLVRVLEITSGNTAPAAWRNDPHIKSPSLQPPFVFGAWGKLSLGDSVEAVTSNMGEPFERQQGSDSEATLLYQSTCSCDLYSGISFTFRGGRLVRVSYWQDFG